MIDFRNATENDIPQIQKIAAETWPATYGKILSAAQIEYMLDLFYSAATLKNSMKSQNFILAIHHNEIVGFCGIEHNFHSAPITRIHKLYILPKAQGLNIGKQFIEKITEMAIIKGCSKLSLNVNRYNSALDFYKHSGFTIIREENIDIGNDYLMEDYVMEKDI